MFINNNKNTLHRLLEILNVVSAFDSVRSTLIEIVVDFRAGQSQLLYTQIYEMILFCPSTGSFDNTCRSSYLRLAVIIAIVYLSFEA